MNHSSRATECSIRVTDCSIRATTSLIINLAAHNCLPSTKYVLKVTNLASMNSAQCPELCFYTGGHGCWMIAYIPYHMIYTQIRLAIM